MPKRRIITGIVVGAAAVASCSSTSSDTSPASAVSPAPSTVAADTPTTTTAPSSTTAPSTTVEATSTSSAAPETSAATVLSVETVAPGTADAISVPADAHGSILMVKMYVGDMAAAERFYGQVFGATTAMQMGDTVHIVTLPDGGPGLVLIQRGNTDENKVSAVIMKVPDLAAARDRAVANGAELQGNFAGQPGGQQAQSIDLLDPWGNQIEILQLG